MTMRTRPGNSHDDSRGTRLPFSHTPVKLGPVIVDSLAMERALTGACARPRAFHLMGPGVKKIKVYERRGRWLRPHIQPIAGAAGRAVTDAVSDAVTDAAETVATGTHAVTTKYLPLDR